MTMDLQSAIEMHCRDHAASTPRRKGSPVTENKEYIEHLREMGACYEALTWLKENKFPTFNDAWVACPKPEWLVWYAARCTYNRYRKRQFIQMLCTITNLVDPDTERLRDLLNEAAGGRKGRISNTIGEARKIRNLTHQSTDEVYIRSLLAVVHMREYDPIPTNSLDLAVRRVADTFGGRAASLEVIFTTYPKPPRQPIELL